MRRKRPVVSALTAALACVALALATACSADGEDSEKRTPSPSATKGITQACPGIIDAQIIAEARNSELWPQTQVGPSISIKQAAGALQAAYPEPSPSPHRLCALTDKKSNLLRLGTSVTWADSSKVTGKPFGRDETARYETGNSPSNAGTLWVACHLKGAKETPARTLLRFTTWDALKVREQSHAKMLIASAKKLTARMGCTNTVSYPDPEETV
ncbi:hypothetical protein AB0933_13545 [Streptomyces venezuelae]|uniref:hypothetical protein n=1 Tax=Streptomyces venezuelae TaxID=54571 RepID=UPI0034548169